MLEVTQHAIERYKERSRQFDISDDQAKAALVEIAEWGQILGLHRGCYFVEYTKQIIIISQSKKTGISTVRTYLGDRQYIHYMSFGEQLQRFKSKPRKRKR